MSSAPIGVMKASLRATRRARLRTSARCSASRTRVAASPIAGGPGRQGVHAFARDLGLAAEHAQDVRVLRQEPAQSRLTRINPTPPSIFQKGSMAAPMMPAAGIVVSQDRPMSRDDVPADVAPAPAPDADPDDRGGDHLGRADRDAEDRRREDDAGRARLADEPVEAPDGEQPPADRPDDRPAAERGADRDRQRRSPAIEPDRGMEASTSARSARSSAAMMPTDFWASFEPWLNASQAHVANCAVRIGERKRVVARRMAREREPFEDEGRRRVPRSWRRGSRCRTPKTPLTRPAWIGPQLTAVRPESRSAAPTRPPTSAWLELDGRPRRQATRFQMTAPLRPAPMTATAWSGVDRHHRADRVGDGGPDEQRPEEVEHGGEEDGRERARGARGDQGRDRVRGVEEPVRHAEARSRSRWRGQASDRPACTCSDGGDRARRTVLGRRPPIIARRVRHLVRRAPVVPAGCSARQRQAARCTSSVREATGVGPARAALGRADPPPVQEPESHLRRDRPVTSVEAPGRGSDCLRSRLAGRRAVGQPAEPNARPG